MPVSTGTMLTARPDREPKHGRAQARVLVVLAAGLTGVVLMVVAMLAIPVRAQATPPVGSLSQLASPFNCVSEEGYEQEVEVFIGCGTLLPRGTMDEAYEAQVSPDGKNVYSVAVAGALVEYSRNRSSGALTPIGCVTSASEPCASENATVGVGAMANPAAIALSPDDRNVYVVTKGGNAIVEFSREPETGLLKEIGCIEEAGSECVVHEAKGIDNPYDVVVSPDGENVYVTSFGKSSVAEFSRNAATGELTQLSPPNDCITAGTIEGTGCGTGRAIGMVEPIGLTVSPDSKDVYVASRGTAGEGSIAAFAREPGGALKQLAGTEGCISTFDAECAPGLAINGPEDLLVSPDGHNLYANSNKDNAVLEFKREASGALVQLPPPNTCIMTPTEEVPAQAGCSTTKGLESTLGVAISPGGENVYASSSYEDDEAVFDRNAETGVLTPLPSPYECLGKAPYTTCATTGVEGIAHARRVTVSPDGKNVYAAGQNDRAVVEFAREVPSAELPMEPGSKKESEPRSPASTGPPNAPTIATVPPPALAKTGNVAPVSGTVLVKLPGTTKFVPLSTLEQIPFGSVIEATGGTVSVTTAEPGGKTQTGEFFEGEFILRQGPDGLVVAELTGGNFSVCPTARERAHKAGIVGVSDAAAPASWPYPLIAATGPDARLAAASGSHVVRKLWANAHGKFSTKGNYAAGAVQGTEWLTEDLCDGTDIKVMRDEVAVTNLVNHRKVEVKTGHRYLAKAP